MKRFLSYFLLALVALLCLSVPTFAQYSTFIVDDDGNPATTYPTLAQAIATAQTFSGGPHKIVIMPGNYSDINLVPNPAKIGEIYGDPSAAPGDIIFTSPAGTNNFITLGLDQKIRNMTLVGYKGFGVKAIGNNVTIEDMIINGASGTGVQLTGVDNVIVQNLTLSNLTYGVRVTGAGATNTTIQMLNILGCTTGITTVNFTTNGVIDKINDSGGTYGFVIGAGTTGAMITNSTVYGTSNLGIWLAGVGGSRVENNLVYGCGNYGIDVTTSSGQNYIRYNCLINNVGTSQGYDDGAAGNWWDGNYYSDNVYTMAPGIITDANPKQYTLSAAAAAASYNIGDTVLVDFNWGIPVCSDLDSTMMAAYAFTVTFNPAMLQFVPGSANYDQGYLGPAPPALYTAIDASTAGQLTFGAANFTAPGLDGGRLGFAKFVVVGANAIETIGFTGTDFRDPGNNAMSYATTSLALTLVDNVIPVLTSLTANNPDLDDTYSDGSTAGPGPFTQLFLTMTATDNYDLAMFQWNSDGGPWSNYIPVPGAHPLASGTGGPIQYNFVGLGLPEGSHVAGIRVTDAAGNVSAPVYYNYTIDRTAPAVPTVAILDADGCALNNSRWTNDPAVTLNITSDGTATDMMVSESGDQPIVAFAASSSFTMTGVNGAHTVWVRLYDKYNNRVDWTPSNVITLDNVAPVVVGPLVISGSPKTSNPNVMVTLTDFGMGGYYGEFGVTETSANFVCGNAVWKSLIPANYGGSGAAFTLSGGDALKHVYLAARDSAGNISNVITNTITLDQTAPVLNTYVLTSLAGTSCTPDGQVKAVYTWTGPDAAKLQYSYDGTTWGDWKVLTGLPSPDSTTGSVPNVAGLQNLYIRIVDDVNNISNVKLGTVTVDNAAPTMGTAVCVDAAATATPDPIYPGGVTNNIAFIISLGTVSSNVVAVSVSQDGGTTWADFPATPTAGTINLPYTWVGTPAQCSWYPLQVAVKNCAGTASGILTPQVYFDLALPTVTGLTGPALTNNPVVPLTITAADNCGLYQMRLAEGSTAGKPWVPYNATPNFTLATGDGNHTIYLDVADYGGNIASANITVKLDQTLPTAGTFVIASANPLAAPGWTDSQSGNTATITWVPDVKSIWIQNINGTNATGWITPPATYALPPIVGLVGLDSVAYWYLDSANNQAGPFYATINYDPANPPYPAAAIGMPHGSTILSWSKVTKGQKYYIKYNYQNQYPLYPDPIPPHPNNRLTEGIFEAEVADTFYTFEGPQPDIYSFSIWTLGKNGHYSTGSNQDVTATNYILGDFSPLPDSCITFGAEFGALAVAYNSVSTDPNFNDSLDIAPTHNTEPWGYPVPDQAIDFEDLVIFALNYDAFHCGSTAPENRPTVTPEATSTLPIAVEVTVPDHVNAGEVVTLPVKLDNFADVKGYHIVLDYNTSDFELVKVVPGDAYTSIAESFFYYDRKSTHIDVSGVVLGAGVTFSNGDFFSVILKARSTGDVNIRSNQLTFRDRGNNDISSSLGVVKAVSLPKVFALSQNYPNPFNPTTTIQLSLPVASDYKLTIFNVLGQVVKTFAGHAEAGYMTIDWDASASGSGIYLYKLEAGNFSATKKMVLIK